MPTLTTHHPTRASNVRTYKPLQHPHAPEVEQSLASIGAHDAALHFVPVSGPFTRGIFATSFAHVSDSISDTNLIAKLESAYALDPFIRVPKGRLPEVIAVSGSNYAEVGWALGRPQDGKRLVTCFSALDNLIKGGAGQVIQNMNLMLGLEETTALEDTGSYP